MNMFGMIGGLARAAVAVALTPVAVVVDLATLPASAEVGGQAFGRTGALLSDAGKNIANATKPN